VKVIKIPNPEDRKVILAMINLVSADKFTINDDGILMRDGNKKNDSNIQSGGSQAFSKALQSGMEKGFTITLQLGEDYLTQGVKKDVYNDANGGVTSVQYTDSTKTTPTGNSTVTLSPKGGSIQLENGTSRAERLDEVMIHEIVGHAIPAATKTKGNAVANENQIRAEMRWDLRKAEAKHDSY
jgi:hypothetical protein